MRGGHALAREAVVELVAVVTHEPNDSSLNRGPNGRVADSSCGHRGRRGEGIAVAARRFVDGTEYRVIERTNIFVEPSCGGGLPLQSRRSFYSDRTAQCPRAAPQIESCQTAVRRRRIVGREAPRRAHACLPRAASRAPPLTSLCDGSQCGHGPAVALSQRGAERRRRPGAAEAAASHLRGTRTAIRAGRPTGTPHRVHREAQGTTRSRRSNVIAPDGGEATRVTNLATGAAALKWYPDGKRIALVSWVWPDLRTEAAQAKRAKRNARTRRSRRMSPNAANIAFWDHWLTDGREPHVLACDVATGRCDVSSSPGRASRCSPGTPSPCITTSRPTAASWH